jgi:hypothetical protein
MIRPKYKDSLIIVESFMSAEIDLTAIHKKFVNHDIVFEEKFPKFKKEHQIQS